MAGSSRAAHGSHNKRSKTQLVTFIAGPAVLKLRSSGCYVAQIMEICKMSGGREGGREGGIVMKTRAGV
jgi:hypothetical protein